MGLLSRDQLKDLLSTADTPCVSLYLPTVRGGREVRQNAIRFKNLLGRAEAMLEPLGRVGDPGRLLAPARRLADDETYWRHQEDGLAVFLSAGRCSTFRVPMSFEERVTVDDSYHLRPLLPLAAGSDRFSVLVLSQNRVRVLEATEHTVRELDLHSIPASLEDAVGYDWEQRSLQFHGEAPRRRGAGRRDAIHHGQGFGSDQSEREVERFLQLVDAGVRELVGDERRPLVVAGVESVAAVFRKISKHPDLVDDVVAGNHDDTPAEVLRERAWKVVAPRFEAARRAAAEQFGDRIGTGLASADLGTVLPAALDGRVDALFVARGERRWGRYDAAARLVAEHATAEDGDDDLLDRVALEAWVRGAAVHVVSPGEVPGGGVVAATFRY